MSVEKGIPYIAEPAGFTEKQAKRVIVNKPTVDICNLKNVFIDPTCRGNFENAQFVVHAYESSLSELKTGDLSKLGLSDGATITSR